MSTPYIPRPRFFQKDCDHLQWWEHAFDGRRYRKCVLCPRIEVYEDGAWVRPKRQKKQPPFTSPQ